MELIIAIIGTISTILAIIFTNFFNRRNELIFKERKLKEDYYIKYIEAVSELAIKNSSEDAQYIFADAQNQLLLVASPNVVSKLMLLDNYIKPSNDNFTYEGQNIILTELIKAMRYDLYQSKKVNRLFPIIHLSGKSKRTDNKISNEVKI
ncbi:MAG: hypothetical protein HFJ40_01920 [Clostridia bacterium]|nr:hypothetical protein [Clostridia bacterium]